MRRSPFLALTALVAPFAAFAAEVDPRMLAANPEAYTGPAVDLAVAYCGDGGDAGGYICSTTGSVFVRIEALTANAAKAKIDNDCGGIDWVERSPSCRFRLRFAATMYAFDTQIEPGKRSLVFYAAQATAR